MRTSIVPENHHAEMRRKALEAELLAARKEEIDAADEKQRKKIFREIEKAVRDKLKDEPSQGLFRFIIR